MPVLAPRARPRSHAVRAAVCAVALAAALPVVTGRGDAYWACVPAALVAAAPWRRRRASALAAGLVIGAAILATVLRVPAADRPEPWAGLLVPLAAVAVLVVQRDRLVAERDALRAFAITDPLTGIANRRLLSAQAEHELARHRRAGAQLTVLMLDLDGFKRLNDRYGHPAGDELLRDVARALSRTMRAQDTVARLGGDEFCVLAPETGATGAERLVARVVAAVGEVSTGLDVIRASVGTAVFPRDGSEATQLLRAADDRLLADKRARYAARPADSERRAA